MSVTFEEQKLQAGAAGADGLCGLCGYTYVGPTPMVCAGCGQAEQQVELTDRGPRRRSCYKEPLPEGYASGVWLEAQQIILKVARALNSGPQVDRHALAVELYKLLSSDAAPMIILYRNSCTQYDVQEAMAEIITRLATEQEED